MQPSTPSYPRLPEWPGVEYHLMTWHNPADTYAPHEQQAFDRRDRPVPSNIICQRRFVHQRSYRHVERATETRARFSFCQNRESDLHVARTPAALPALLLLPLLLRPLPLPKSVSSASAVIDAPIERVSATARGLLVSARMGESPHQRSGRNGSTSLCDVLPTIQGV